MEKRLYNGQSLEGIGTTLSISAYGDTLEELRINLYNEGKMFFGHDYKVMIPDELDMVIRGHSGEGKYFGSTYVKGIRKNEASMVLGRN
jgi:hypothetical protein